MTSFTDLAQKRAMLFSARLQFSPELQPYRDRTIDRLVEQSLLIADQESGLNLQQIEQQRPLTLGNGQVNRNVIGKQTPIISQAEIQASLNRLANQGRAIMRTTDFGMRYRLSINVLEELQQLQWQEANRFTKVVDLLFRDASHPSEEYGDAFFECLCHIFSRLGESYVQVLLGNSISADLLDLAKIKQGIDSVKQHYLYAKDQQFERAVRRFFGENNPDFDAIKWRLAQNYYLAKALGLDKGGSLLSTEIFGKAQFYLDTNVIFQAVEPRMQRHRSFAALMTACKRLNISVYVCQVSLDEMRNAVGNERALILKVEDKIPEALAARVRRNLYEIYLDEKQQKGQVDIDTLFADFINPMAVLRDQYQIELIDDLWFSTATGEKVIQDLGQQIVQLARQRGKIKGRGTAQHDALMLSWVQRQREAGANNTWLVTLDTLLPVVSFSAKQSGQRTALGSNDVRRAKPVVLTLDALLQWISPLVPYETDEGEIAAIFAEAVKYQLLPQDGFFDLKDFRVFAELDISVRELPVEDVEDCLLYIRSSASHLDPSNPQDLQKLGLEIQKFFADPGRKYQQNLSRLEEANMLKEQELQQERLQRQQSEEALRRENDEKIRREREAGEALRVKQQQDFDARLAAMQRDIEEKKQKQDEAQLKKIVRRKLWLCGVLFLVITGTAIFLAIFYGDPTKAYMERISSSAAILGGVLAFELLVFALIIGRKGFQVLDFPGWEVWKNNPDKK